MLKNNEGVGEKSNLMGEKRFRKKRKGNAEGIQGKRSEKPEFLLKNVRNSQRKNQRRNSQRIS